MKQTVKNMDNIVIKIVEVTDANNKGINFESTQEAKTLINTYGTLLGDIRRLSHDEFDELIIEKELYEQGEKLKLVVEAIDGTVIPSELTNGNLKSVDNLAITTSKIKSILRDIKHMTKSYEIQLSIKKFREKTYSDINNISESDMSTLGILHRKLKNLYNERDVINATYMDEASDRDDWKDVTIKIKTIKELIDELA